MLSSTVDIPQLSSTSLLGHLPAFRDDRAGFLLRVADRAPGAAMLRVGIFSAVSVSSPELAHEVLQAKAASFVKSPGLSIFLRPLLGNGLLTNEGSDHARQRRLLAPAFAHKRVASYAATMAERAERTAEGLADGERIDAAETMMRLTLEIVGKTLFDAEVGSDAAAVGEALTTAMELAMGQMASLFPLPPAIPSPSNLRSRRAVARLDEVVYRIIRERRGKHEDRGDVLSILLSAKDEDGTTMTDEQIRDEAMTLFLAGHETTANALTWALYLLARHPDVQSRVEREVRELGLPPTHADLERLPLTLATLKEAMRLYPPAYMIGRQARADVAIGSHHVKKGQIVVVNVLGIHHRSDLWPDPTRFDPERFMNGGEKALPRCAYLPFGAGPRVCIGNHFALMEGQVILATLLRRARFHLLRDEPPELEPLVTLRPRFGLPMRVERLC